MCRGVLCCAVRCGAFTPQCILLEPIYHIGTHQIGELPPKGSDLVYFAGFLASYFLQLNGPDQ